MRTLPISRRAFMAMSSAFAASLFLAMPAMAAANPAEDFVQDNIHKGLEL